MSRRRIGNLTVFLAVAAVASALGYVRWQVPALLVPWIVSVWVAARAIAASPPQRAEWVETVSYSFNAVLLTFAAYYLGGARWLASAFYVLLVITAAASLPMLKAGLVTFVAWLGFAIMAFGHATGRIVPPGFLSGTTPRVSMSFAILTTLVVGVTLILALLLQESLLGALRRSELRHRAILNAASDMVVVLDREGRIQRASEVFAERTAFPIRELVGTRFGEIVDSSHREEWTKELGVACTGEHVAFSLPYRSMYANQGWIAGTLVPLPPEAGEERVLMIARDVSAERKASTVREAGLAREVATLQLASLDTAIREVVRDVDTRLRAILREVATARSSTNDAKAQAELRAVADQLDETRDKAHELIERLDMFKASRKQGSTERKASSA
jgi:PAS domain S-box-containing protein